MKSYRFVIPVICCLFAAGAAVAASKLKVGTVSFDGNTAFADARLSGLMLTHPSRFLSSAYYYPDVFADDLDHLLAFYRQNGYLEAAISDTLVVVDTSRGRVDIRIGINEGEVARLDGITVFGNDKYPDSLVRSHIALQPGDPLRRRIIQEGVLSILSMYAENGYLDASVSPAVRINAETHLAIVDIIIEEHGQAVIDSILIDGLRQTRRHVILRELAFRRNDIARYSELVESQRRLYLTGLFESAFVRAVASPSGDSTRKNVLVELREKPPNEFGIMVGYGSLEKLRGRIELSTFNLAGTARQAGAAVEADFIKQGTSLSFTEPWTLGTRWQTDINLFLEFHQEPGYQTRNLGGRLTVGRKLGYHTNISLAYRLENTDITDIELLAEIEETDPRIRSLTASITYDSRDNLFDPQTGLYTAWVNEIAGAFMHGTNTFARSVATAKLFRPIGNETVFGAAVEIGWMDYFASSDNIPLNERFYTGGPTTIRAFGYQMVGPLDANDIPIGGKFKLVTNLEIRRTIYKIFGAAAFLDVGNVWTAINRFRPADLRSAVGAGLRVNSPLGILRLDYGVNVDPENNEPGGKLFLGMGQAF